MNELKLGSEGSARTLYYEPEGLLLQAGVVPHFDGAALLLQALYLGNGVLAVEVAVSVDPGLYDGHGPASIADTVSLQGHDEKHAPGGWLTIHRLPGGVVGHRWTIRSPSVDGNLPRGEIRCDFRGRVDSAVTVVTYAGATRPAT